MITNIMFIILHSSTIDIIYRTIIPMSYPHTFLLFCLRRRCGQCEQYLDNWTIISIGPTLNEPWANSNWNYAVGGPQMHKDKTCFEWSPSCHWYVLYGLQSLVPLLRDRFCFFLGDFVDSIDIYCTVHNKIWCPFVEF